MRDPPVEMAKKRLLQTLAGNSKNISDLQGAMNLAILDGIIVDERKFMSKRKVCKQTRYRLDPSVILVPSLLLLVVAISGGWVSRCTRHWRYHDTGWDALITAT
jgi:hypothetical protein